MFLLQIDKEAVTNNEESITLIKDENFVEEKEISVENRKEDNVRNVNEVIDNNSTNKNIIDTPDSCVAICNPVEVNVVHMSDVAICNNKDITVCNEKEIDLKNETETYVPNPMEPIISNQKESTASNAKKVDIAKNEHLLGNAIDKEVSAVKKSSASIVLKGECTFL